MFLGSDFFSSLGCCLFGLHGQVAVERRPSRGPFCVFYSECFPYSGCSLVFAEGNIYCFVSTFFVFDYRLPQTDLVAAGNCMFLVVQATSLIASLLSPFVPTFSEQLCAQLDIHIQVFRKIFFFFFFIFWGHVCFLISWSQRIRGPAFSFDVNGGHKIASDKVAVIVEQIEGDRILQWWEKYG